MAITLEEIKKSYQEKAAGAATGNLQEIKNLYKQKKEEANAASSRSESMRTSLGRRPLGADQPVEIVSAKSVVEKPSLQQNQISGEIAARTSGSGSTDSIGTAAHMTKLSGLQVQEAELKLSQSKAKVDAARQKEAALAEQNKKLASAQHGMQDLLTKYQMTGDEVTGRAYLLAAEEYNKMLEQYQKDYEAYEKETVVYDQYNTDLLKYQKAYAAYEKSVADYDKVTKPQREYEERLRHVQELRENQSVDYLQDKKNKIENQIQSIYNDPEYYNRREIYQAAVAEGRMTGEELEAINPDREVELLRLRMENLEQEIENKRSASWEAEQTEQILEAGGEQLLKDLKELASLEQMVRAEKITARNPDNNFTLQTTSKTENKYQKKQQEIARKYGQIPAEWYDYAKRAQEQESYDSAVATFGEEAKKTPVAASVLSVPLNVFGGIAGMGNIAGQKITNALLGKETPTNFKNAATLGSAGSQAVRQSVSEQIEATGAGKVGSFLYNTGMSMLDSAAILGLSALGLPSGLGTTMLGSSAAISTLQDAMENGATENQALALGILAGLAEGFFEKYSIDSLIDISDTKTARDLFMNILKQGGIEASEEAATTLANTAADLVIMGNKNQLARAKQDYISAGLSAQEAEIKAGTDWLLGLAMDAVGGFLSGGLFGTIGGTADMIRNKSADRKAQSTTGQVNAESTESTVTQKPADMKKTTPVNAVDVENTEVNDGLQWAGNQNEGGTENVRTEQTGEPGADGDIGREDDLGTGERTGSGETGDVAGENGTDQTARYVEDLRRIGYLSEVKSETLGFSSIESKKNIAVIRTDQYNEAMQAQADKARAMGVEFELVADRIPLEQNGKKMKAAGIHKPGKIIVQANNAKISMEQATDHELFHELAERDPELVNTAVQALQDEYDQTELDEMYQKYAKTYGKAYNDGRATDEQVAQRIYEEMLADAYADYERFAGNKNARRYRDTVRRVAAESVSRTNAKAGTGTSYAQTRKNEAASRYDEAIQNDPRIQRLIRQRERGQISEAEYMEQIEEYFEQDARMRGMTDDLVDADKESFSEDGDNVDINENPYTYEALVSKPDMVVTMVEERDIPEKGKRLDTSTIADDARSKAETLRNDEYGDQKYVYIKDLDAKVLTPKKGFVHGIIGNKTNGSTRNTAEVTYDLTDILKNSIAVNEKNPRTADDGEYSYILFGYAKRISDGKEYIVKTTVNHFGINRSVVDSVEIYDVLKGSKAKKVEPSVRGSHTGEPAASLLNTSGSTTISVAELLETVKENYPELLPDNVREHFGIQDMPKEADMRYSVDEEIGTEEPAGLQWAGNMQEDVTEEADPAPVMQEKTGDSLTQEIEGTENGLTSYMENQSKRTQNRNKALRKQAAIDFAEALGLQTPEGLTETVDEIANEYLVNGRVGSETRQRLFKILPQREQSGARTPEQQQEWAWQDFNAAVNKVCSQMAEVRRYMKQASDNRQRYQETENQEEDVAQLWVEAKVQRREMEKNKVKYLLTDFDKMAVGRLLRGEIQPEHINRNTNNYRGIMAVYEASQAYEDTMKKLRAYSLARKEGGRQLAADMVKDLENWKDKKSGIAYSTETMERNIRKIAPTPEIAEAFIDAYLTPVHKANAQENRLKNAMRKKVADLKLSQKAKKKGQMSESAAVQLLGEARDNISVLEHRRVGEMRDGKTLEEWKAEIDNLWRNNPQLDRAKIEHAIEVFREIYDQLFKMMNETRIRNGYEPINYRKGYFPHFQTQEVDGIFAAFGKAFGIQHEITNLPASIVGLTENFLPGIPWFQNAMKRLAGDTTLDAVQGFDQYLEGAANVIYQTDNIQRLRALEQHLRYMASDPGLQARVEKIREDPNKSDADKQTEIDKLYKEARYGMTHFIAELQEYTNNLANKKSRFDRNMEIRLGRNMYNVVKAMEGRVAANMVAINPGSWLTNFAPLAQGTASVGIGPMVHGMASELKNGGMANLWRLFRVGSGPDGFYDRSTFLTNRRGSERLVQSGFQQVTNVLSSPMQMIDNYVSGSLVRARYMQNLKNGMSMENAMDEADAWAAGIMGDRSKGAMPTIFNEKNPVTKIFTMYQLEVKNQFSWLLKDLPREKREKGVLAIAWAMMVYGINAWLFNELYEFIVGRRPVFDVIGILNDTAGDFFGYEAVNAVDFSVDLINGGALNWYQETQKQKPHTAAINLGKNLLEEAPFVGGLLGGGRIPISSALPNVENLATAAFNSEWDLDRRAETIWQEMSKPLYYIVPPFGGGQVKKVVDTSRAIANRGSYSASGNLQYPVFADETGDAVYSALVGGILGKTSLQTGVEWVDSGFQGLNEKYTGAYRELIDMGEGDRASWELLQAMRDAEVPEGEDIDAERRRILRESGVSGEAKYMVYHDLLASDKEKERMDALEGADPETVFNLFADMKEQDNNGDRLAILRSALTEQEKAILFDSVKEKENARLQAATKYVDSFLYADFLEAYAEEYTKEDGAVQGYSGERVEKILRAMNGVTNEEKAAIWQITANGKEGKSNPFSNKIGKEIWDIIQKLYKQIEDDGGLDWAGRY